MTRLFTDGAERGDLLAFNLATISVSTTQKRTGNYSYYVSGAYNGTINIAASSELYFRFGARLTVSGTNNNFVIVRNGTTSLCSVRHVTSSNKLALIVGSTVVATSTNSINNGEWHLYEIHVKIADSGGVLELKVDGVDFDGASFTGDTKPGTDTTIDNLWFLASGAGASMYLDDIAINNTTGGVDNSWCGDGHVLALKPNANGDSSQFTGSDGNSTDNYLLVDDIPHDSDTSYVQANVSGYYDLYNLEACGLTDVEIKRVWVESIAKDTTTGSGILTPMIKTNSTEVESNPVPLSTSYALVKSEEFLVNPVTLSGWTVEDLDSLQAGVKVER